MTTYNHRYTAYNPTETELKLHCGTIVNRFCKQYSIDLTEVKLTRKNKSYGSTASVYHLYKSGDEYTLQLQQVHSCQHLVELLVRLFTRQLTWSSAGKKVSPFPVLNLIDDVARTHAVIAGVNAESIWAAEWLDCMHAEMAAVSDQYFAELEA